MPVTEFQREVLAIIAKNRSDESHFAGGLVINADPASARFSHDFDIFHAAEAEVARASACDLESLQAAGFEVSLLVGDWSQPSSFRKARVSCGEKSVEIDWAVDSAYRFFPIERDPLLGWRLHLFDVATNKALALSARTETRDYLDIVNLHRIYPLHAIVWAACGKDPGFSPAFLLKMMRRFARIDPVELDKIQARPLDPKQLKESWIEMADRAEVEISALADAQPDMPIGIAFVDAHGRPGWIRDDPTLAIHHPTVGGCLPKVDRLEPEFPGE